LRLADDEKVLIILKRLRRLQIPASTKRHQIHSICHMRLDMKCVFALLSRDTLMT